ncbi:MAG: hypothetical protein AAF492_32280 [Verrucomicrobiota bacterium]
MTLPLSLILGFVIAEQDPRDETGTTYYVPLLLSAYAIFLVTVFALRLNKKLLHTFSGIVAVFLTLVIIMWFALLTVVN